MKLFYAQTSPYARKVRVLAHEVGLIQALELVEVNPWSDEGLRQVNPFCQAPTLVLADGTSLYDSAVICDYLDELGGRQAIPAAGVERMQALKLQALGDGVCNATVRRVRERMRPEADRHADQIERQIQATAAALDVLERDAAALTHGFGIGQISIACTLGYLDLRVAHDQWRLGRPQLAAWFETARRRSSMIATEPPATPPG